MASDVDELRATAVRLKDWSTKDRSDLSVVADILLGQAATALDEAASALISERDSRVKAEKELAFERLSNRGAQDLWAIDRSDLAAAEAKLAEAVKVLKLVQHVPMNLEVRTFLASLKEPSHD